MKYTSRLKEKYRTEVVDALRKRFEYANVMAVPRLEKIVINMGMGETIKNPKVMDVAVDELTGIAGQKPVITKAKKPISSFKLRKGMPIGCCVTLRRDRMFEFLDRLVNVALPRVRDFKGVSPRSFDGRGNYTLGLKDQLIFPDEEHCRGTEMSDCQIATQAEISGAHPEPLQTLRPSAGVLSQI